MNGSLHSFRKSPKDKQASVLRYFRPDKPKKKKEDPIAPKAHETSLEDAKEVNGSSLSSPNKLEVNVPSCSQQIFVKPVPEKDESFTDPLSQGININAVLKNGHNSIPKDPLAMDGDSDTTSMGDDSLILPQKRKRVFQSDSDEELEPPAKHPAIECDSSKNEFSDEYIENMLETYSNLYKSIEKMEILDCMKQVNYNFTLLNQELDRKVKSNQKQSIKEKLEVLAKAKQEKHSQKAQLKGFRLTERNQIRQEKLAAKNKKKQLWKMKGKNVQDYEEEDEEDYIKDTAVYESDSSEEDEGPVDKDDPEKTAARQAVLDFFNNGSLNEITSIPGCSRKKADIVLQNRPYDSWTDIVHNFQTMKMISPEMLNSAKDLLIMRDGVSKLMKKCEHIAVNMNTVVTEIIEGQEAEGVNRQPETLNKEFRLKPYQMVGLNWLVLMYQQGLNGVLADEMGLGKTIQSIAFLAYLKEQKELDKLCLIVVPSSTLENWSKELEQWCPTLGVLFYHGSQQERRGMRAEIANDELDESIDLILTTYNMITSSAEDKGLFKKLPFHTVIFDEAHMLKNMASQRYESLMRIKTKHRLLLTGTPLQNNLVELMSILVFVMPELFEGRKEQLKKMFSMFPKSDSDRSRAQYEKEKIEQAKRIMKPFFLRRLKDDVLKDLPTKECHLIKVPMSLTRQHSLYKSTVQNLSKRAEEIREELSAVKEDELEALTSIESEKGKHQKTNHDSSSNMLMTLRKLANHPLLIRNLYTDSDIKKMSKILLRTTHTDSNLDYVIEDFTYMSDFEIHKTCLSFKPIESYKLTDEVIKQSGKFEQFDKMLPKIKQKGERVLIFSQFVIMLDIIEEYMKISGHSYYRLDGSTQVSDRQEMIDDFNENDDIFVFLLSTRAGGLGINLTSANNVILHDIDFNPYNDRQAEDRCHRVGQTRNVTVHRFISKDSIEEGIYQIALQKLQLEKDVTGNEEGSRKADVLTLLRTALTVSDS